MWVLIFYVNVGMNAVPLSQGEVDTFEYRHECVIKAERMKQEMKESVKYKCVNIVFNVKEV